ncbi:hypothetical protein F5B18DRAFT_667815 [Nemania serpens]|nr:hypothetical protein F5B18DRAFT_667815 [Nemania serpens]
MGNTPSVEVPKGSRAAQKLSKPRTGNLATAGLLNPSGVSDLIRRPPSTSGRRLSLPYSSTPVSSPRPQEADDSAVDDLVALYGASALVEDYPSNSAFRSDSEALHQEGQAVGVVASSSRDRRMSRTDSAYLGVDKGYEQAQLGSAVSSRNYDLSSYEPNRLLNAAGEPPFEDRLIVSENELQAAPSRRQSYTTSYRPTHSDAATFLPRANSDASLYTPMRRRSLMTPGVATRPTPTAFMVPPEIETDHNIPPSPSRCYSPEPMSAGFLSIPHSSFDPGLIPRVHTPCETEYKQTGAFKHGTLRITNGSPARTPAWDTAENSLRANSSLASIGRGSYFDDEIHAKGKQGGNTDNIQGPFVTGSSVPSASNLATVAGEQDATLDFLPELELTLSPFSISEIEQVSSELQTTSKHTAIEDELFEDGFAGYSTEVLNVRIDHDAKPRSPLPGAPSSDGQQRDIDRSDSGVAAGPTAGAPHKSLSKADSGYSSSVSIRSGTSKRKGQQESGHSRNIEAISPQTLAFDHANLPKNTSVQTHLTTVGAFEVQSQSFSPNGLPPLVPKTGHYTHMPKPVTAPARDPETLAGMPSPVSDEVSAGEPPESANTSAFSRNGSYTLTSNMSIGNERKAGRFQRLLSSARTPLAVHITHALDSEAKVPPVSQAAQKKGHEHAGVSPSSCGSPYEDALTARENSKSTTFGRIFIAHGQDSAIQTAEDNGSSTRINPDKTHGLKSRTSRINSIGSRITLAASSVMSKNLILRKPIFAKAKPGDRDDTPATDARRPGESSQWHPRGVENINTISLPLASGKASALTTGRSNSLSAFEGGLNLGIHDDVRQSSLISQSEQHALSFQRPSFLSQHSTSRTPPPVSMKTRNIGLLRVPPPIRARSTPPITPETFALSHKPSQDVHSYPPYTHSMNSNYTALPRRSSQESFYNYSTAQIQAFSNQPSQYAGTAALLPSNIQHHPGGYRTAGGVPNSKNSTATFWEPSSDYSRRNSLASQTSQRSVPNNLQPWSHYSPYDNPTPRHRSSYDGSSSQIQQSYGRDNGTYSTLPHANGQMYVSDPLRRQPIPQQSRQHQQDAQYPPRGHLRHHSLDQHGSPVQYRVLHSYNSPAYRGVPIWSS